VTGEHSERVLEGAVAVAEEHLDVRDAVHVAAGRDQIERASAAEIGRRQDAACDPDVDDAAVGEGAVTVAQQHEYLADLLAGLGVGKLQGAHSEVEMTVAVEVANHDGAEQVKAVS